jgi:hypothetical protein
MFGLPKLGSKTSKGSESSGEDFDTAMKQVDELSEKLDEAQVQIFAMLTAAIPKVDIKLPQLSPSLFCTTACENDDNSLERAPLLVAESDLHDKARLAKSASTKKIADVQAKAIVAQHQLEQARIEMENNAKKTFVGQACTCKRLATQGMVAVGSLVMSVALAYLHLGALLGPLLAGIASAILNFLGLAHAWKQQADGIFAVTNGVFDRLKDKVLQVLDAVDDMIATPLHKLESAIDHLCEEQAPTLGNMKKFETALRTIDPDFDLPEPADLKVPLDGCDAMIDEFVDKAKREIPDKLEEMVQQHLPSRIATDSKTFSRYIVVAPLSIVFSLNLSLAVLQVFVSVANKSASSPKELSSTCRVNCPCTCNQR